VKIKIMAVDDEPVVLSMLKTLLQALGYQVLAIGDSREALKRLKIEKVDGLFVDVRMPHLDGFDLARETRLLNLNGQVPIVMLTGQADGATMRRGFNMGVSFFLGKPFTRERVYKMMGAIKGPMSREQARYMRIPLHTPVGCSWGFHSPGHYKSNSENISEGGMRLNPLGGLGVGNGLSLIFALPGVQQKFTVDAIVVREVADGGAGVKFINLPSQEKAALQLYISNCARD